LSYGAKAWKESAKAAF